MTPVRWAFLWLGLLSLSYEPVRQAMYRLGDSLGGVGGVGGLTNQFTALPPMCNGRNITGETNVPYCFKPGVMGFTPFALVMLVLCTLPLCLATLATYYGCCTTERNDAKDPKGLSAAQTVSRFSLVLGISSALWFSVPLAYFATSPFYQKDFWHALLVVSLASAFPLSWLLMLVAIPSAGAPVLVPLLGVASSTPTSIPYFTKHVGCYLCLPG